MDDNQLELRDSESLAIKLMAETNPTELQNIIDLFNVNFKKRDIVRTEKLNDLQDKISAQMMERVTKKANEFSNKDLLDYFKVIQETINKTDTTLESVKPAAIQINQQNINIDTKPMSRESRDKITSVIDSILAKAQAQEQDNPPIIESDFQIVDNIDDQLDEEAIDEIQEINGNDID